MSEIDDNSYKNYNANNFSEMIVNDEKKNYDIIMTRMDEFNEIDEDVERSSNHHTRELINCLENNSKIFNYNSPISKSKSNSKSSISISRDSIIKSDGDTNHYLKLNNRNDNLIDDFEHKWKTIEKSKIINKTQLNEIKNKRDSEIKKNKKYNKIVSSKDPIRNSYKQRLNDEINKNYNNLNCQSEQDIDNLMIRLRQNHQLNLNNDESNMSYIFKKHLLSSNVRYTKPSNSCFISISDSTEKIQTNTKRQDKSNKIKSNYQTPKTEVSETKITGETLKKKLINTYEDIVCITKTLPNCESGNTKKEKIKEIISKYKDLNSIEKNFYSILKDINPKIIKDKQTFLFSEENIRLKNCYSVNKYSTINTRLKRNKNYINIENNFSLINRIANSQNRERIYSNEEKNHDLKFSNLNKKFANKNVYKNLIPESPKIGADKKLSYLQDVFNYPADKKNETTTKFAMKNEFKDLFNILKIKKC